MKKFIVAALSLVFVQGVSLAQCLQIESILVDACVPGGGCTNAQSPNCNCEGKNEMVLFKVGGSALTVANLSVVWPNNSFKGWNQNASTAANVATLNATILSCGYLKEPLSGTLPASAEVLIITSWDMCTSANSFANLQDTLYVLFQDTGNYQGHFANTNNNSTITTVPTGTVSLRNLTINYPGCTQTVTYDRSQLVNSQGTYGGGSALNDGSTVLFDAAGNPSYINNGCQAPYIPVLVDAGASVSACYNDTAFLNGSLSGPYTSFSWSGGAGSFGNPASDTTYYVPGPGESGTVTLYLTAQGKCSGTGVIDSVQVTIIPAPAPLIAGSSAPLCSGSPAVLTVNVQTGTTYTWMPGNATGASFTVSPSAQTIYTVTASNGCGSASDTFLVNVNPLPVVNVLNDTICSGSVGTLTATGAGTYTWSTGATGASISGLLTATAQFTVTGTDTNGCTNSDVAQIIVNPLPVISVNSASICPGGATTLTASGASSYTWSTSQTTASITVSPASSTIYIVKGEDANGCATTVSASVTVYTPPAVAVAGAGICPGGTATLTASGANTYTWSTSQTGSSITVSPSTATNYTVTGTDVNGCVNATVVTVTINPLPVITVSPVSTCPGVPTSISASGASTYTWSTAQTGASVTVPGVAATYTVTGTDTNGCISSAAGAVSLLPLPAPQTILGAAVICQGETDTLYVMNNNYTYTWTGPMGPAGTGTAVAVTQAGVYTVTAMNSCGGTPSEFTVSVSAPQAGFAPNVITAPVPATFVFTNSSQGTSLVNYWNFGNGDTSSALNPAATYTVDGAYPVTLIVTDSYGCMDTATFLVMVTDTTPPVIIPNIFSPNGDNVNDLFTIKGKGLTYFDCVVYDRWGIEMYSWSDISGGWDGKNQANGKSVSDGTYYVLVTYIDKRGKLGVQPAYVQLVH
jgi:gliding motility-associated-like protein